MSEQIGRRRRAPSRLLAVMVALLAGCARPSPLLTETPQQIAAEQTDTLCLGLAYQMPPDRRQLIVGELLHRQAIRPEFLPALDLYVVQVGMNTCEAHAAYGLPYTVQRHETMAGESLELIYRYIGDDGHVGPIIHRVRIDAARGFIVTSVRDY